MRRLRLTAASTCTVGALLVAPVITLPTLGPKPIAASLAYSPLAKDKAVVPDDADPTKETREVTPSDEFTTAGVVWDYKGAASNVEMRIQETDGTWSDWTELHTEHEGPDANSAEGRRAKAGTPPIHVNAGQRVQVRVPKGKERVLEHAQVVTVDPGTSAADGSTNPNPLATAHGASPLPAFKTRAQWGANESYRNCNAGIGNTVETVVIHHTAGSNNYTRAGAMSQLRGDYAYHTRALGWCDLGYNAVIDKYGTIYEGRRGGLNRAIIGAHTGGFNNNTWSISLLGDNTYKSMSNAQKESVAKLAAWKLSSYGRNPQGSATLISSGLVGANTKFPRGTRVTRPRIIGHRDLNSTGCPGGSAWNTLPWIRSRAAQIISQGSGPSGELIDVWNKHGGAGGRFGKRISDEKTHAGGRYIMFEHGAIFRTPHHGIRMTYGGIHIEYMRFGGPTGPLGLPTTNEYDLPRDNGRGQDFDSGASIFWSWGTGPKVIYGGIKMHYLNEGGVRGYFGLPVTNEADIPNYVGAGRYQVFQGGEIWWGPRVASITLRGGIKDEFYRRGGAARVGMPVGQPRKFRNGEGQPFELANVWIYGSARTGYHMTLGGIRWKYDQLGGPNGPLGLPTGIERSVPGGQEQSFQHGKLFWNASTGAVTRR